MYLLDTDIVSNVLKNRPSRALVTKWATVPPEEIAVSSVTVGELFYGALKSPDRGLWMGRVERLLPTLPVVLPFDTSAAWQYAQARVHLEKQGSRLDDADLRIAAVALAYDLIMVTANVRHFGRVPGLVVENWLEG